ncbi:Membrane protein TMS1 [Zancudomyces culisetae]|uniref:Membrane protein TMS1 n=1 Tax=Zancudomyces culisetae TaxID=1213189 RepID=A0A1R1PKH6_ZANCU|nr:Membrane protein TMS1 [Zancudomyces culisetae]|eukprot:OMH81382.1 Membrane protein TMS1 [Zancudomyces culisetae]
MEIGASRVLCTGLMARNTGSFGIRSLPVGGKIPSQCNPLIENSGTRTTLIVFGAIFTMAAICYSTSTAATNSGSLINPSEYGPIRLIDNSLLMEDSGVSESELRNRAVNDAVASGALPSAAVMDMPESPSGLNNGGNGDEQESEDDEKHGVIYNYSFFHFIFCVAAMYMAMLLTNWNSIDANSGDFIIIGRSMAAVWVKVVSSWACVALYVWTLVAPVVLSDR